jgi:hypothetical protein
MDKVIQGHISPKKTMKTLKFKRFTKPQFLKQIGRELLGQFLGDFTAEVAAKGITLPAATTSDDEYYEAVAVLALAPEGLPDELVEAIHAIEAMANEEGQERLERAVAEGGMAHLLEGENTQADLALKVYLENPALLAEKLNELQLKRLASFDYFGSKMPVDRSGSFAMPTGEVMGRLTTDLETAFQQRNRGRHTTHVEVHFIEGEYWFLIRHGDTYTRVSTVNGGQVSVIHFRPTKDDVVVFNPVRDEIRIHAATKWERELYRRSFGVRLFGDDQHFSERKAYTLEPLLADGKDSLDVSDIGGISEVVLREYEVAWPGGFDDVDIRKSADVFASAESRAVVAIRAGGRLTRAVFDVLFGDDPKARRVQLRPPNILKLGRHCDAVLVHRWLSARGFRAAVPGPEGSSGEGPAGGEPTAPIAGVAVQPLGAAHEEPVAVS